MKTNLPRQSFFALTLAAGIVLAGLAPRTALAQRQMEKLGRGVIAMRTNTTSVYVGWRLWGTDPEDIGFNVYRAPVSAAAGPVKLNATPLTNSCNLVDTGATLTLSNAYYVCAVINGVEQAPSASYILPANPPTQQYVNIPLSPPPGGTSPDAADGTGPGGPYTYNANDCSAGDVDGDGEYEIILKWDPSNSKDNSQSGYTGDTYLDAYKLDGTRLWRIDLGVNIRSGAHYMDFMVYDFDGDGKAELICRTAPGAKDGLGNYVGGAAKWQNSGGTRPAFSDTDDYRTTGPNGNNGYVLAGPTFLTVFNGLTGEEMATTAYVPKRDPDGNNDSPSASTINSIWGDSYGNRLDRFLAGIAFLDGRRPSAVFCRGYYTRAFLVAWDWRNGQLTRRWTFDSNDGTPGNTAYRGQGAHSLTIGDVDGDGKDEITYGAAAIDDNGKGLYSMGIGHGDAEHMSDLDPNRPGLEVWMVHEDPGSYGPNGLEMRDAKTGKVLIAVDGQSADVGRGVAIDIDPRYAGYEMWGSRGGLMSSQGFQISSSHPSQQNFAVWWDADTLREILDGTTISKWNYTAGTSSSQLAPGGLSSNNGTKSTPALSADLFGDWREEVVWRTADNLALRIYTTTILATNRLYTLMHDPQYRCAVGWQNTGYNQPPHPGFFLGAGMNPQPLAPMNDAKLLWRGGVAGNTWDAATANWAANGIWTNPPPVATFSAGDSVLFDLSGSNNVPVNFPGPLQPGKVTVFAPNDYTFGGAGSLEGTMNLVKAGPGKLFLKTINGYTGRTTVSGGSLFVNGRLDQSPVLVENRGNPEGPARLGGTGVLGQGITLQNHTALSPGPDVGTPGTLAILGALIEPGGVVNEFDLSDNPSGTIKTNDTVAVTGNLSLTGTNSVRINALNGQLASGTYALFQYSGSLTGGLANLKVEGLPGVPLSLASSPGVLALVIMTNRAPTNLVWKGSPGYTWDLTSSGHWLNSGAPDKFVPLDNVRFDDTVVPPTLTVTVADFVRPGAMLVTAAANFTFSGGGAIIGAGELIKTNTGTLTIATTNQYTGRTVIGGGMLSVAALANGGLPSAIGMSGSSVTNLVLLAGGTLRYTGATTSTDRGLDLLTGGGTVEVTSSSAILTFAGSVIGNGSLTKLGSGNLTLNAGGSYTGGTTVRGGTLELGTATANSSGLGSGAVTLTNGGILALYGFDQDDTSAGGPYVNALVVPTNTTGSFYLPFRLSINNPLSGGGTLGLRVNGVRGDCGGNWSAFTGQINVTSFSGVSDWRVNNSAGYPNARVNLAANVTLQNRVSGTPIIPFGELAGAAGSAICAPGGSGGLAVTWRVGGLGTTATYAGSISNNVAITKEGVGTWILTGTNTYTSATTITGGALQIGSGGVTGSLGTGNVTDNAALVFNHSDAISDAAIGVISGNGVVSKRGSGALTFTKAHSLAGMVSIETGRLILSVASAFASATNMAVSSGAALDVSAAAGYALGGGQTLSGNGAIAGPVLVGSGAALSPGSNAIGRLTFSNALSLASGSASYFEITKSPLTNDVAKVLGTLSLGGTLIVTNLSANALAGGDSFKLFDAAGYSGAFATVVLPPLNSGLAWDIGSLNTNGIIRVVTQLPPLIGVLPFTGSSLVITGAGGSPNRNYYVLGSSNLTVPLSNWPRIATGMFNASGVFSFTNAMSADATQQFFRVQVP